MLVFALMAYWTWFSWPDPIVDFGRELYVPWQITQGKVLYRDIAYFNGPLSPYFNALVMKLLGVSLRSIVFANLAILATLTILLWRLLAMLFDRFAATAACVMLLTLFSFIQLSGVGNYNFITPYSHEITHGVVLSIVGITCLVESIRRDNDWWMLAAGAAAGLVFLTKPEIFVAIACASIVVVALSARPGRNMLILAGGVILPLTAAFIIFGSRLCLPCGWPTLLGAWRYMGNRELTGMPFYQHVLGTDELEMNLATIGVNLLAYAVVVGTLVVIGRSIGRKFAEGCIPAAVIVAIIAYHVVPLHWWQNGFRGLIIVTPAIALGAIVLLLRQPARAASSPSPGTPGQGGGEGQREDQHGDACGMGAHPNPLPAHRERGSASRPPCDTAARQLGLAGFAVFAAVLLAKISLRVGIVHYGFALAMPAFLLATAMLVTALPRWVESKGGSGAVVRAIVVPLLALTVIVHLTVYRRQWPPGNAWVGTGADAFRSKGRGHAVDLALRSLAQLPAGATLAVLPEGVMINYLARRTNPTPYINFMPPEVVMFGEANMVRAFERNPPDYIVLVLNSDPSDYGYKPFGVGYGVEILDWIKSNYVEIPSNRVDEYPLVLLKRR